MQVTIATSIAPQNKELQRKALASWKKLGFNIISVNSPEEIKQIKETFPDVKFVETERNASALFGKPFVYFDDVLKALDSTGSPICGIVNSDIYLIAGDDLYEFISEEAQEGFVFGSRVDVASLSCLEGNPYVLGFDFFFFSRTIIAEYRQTDFCLGVPWWDYWMLAVPILKGLSVKHLITPVAFHIQHPARLRQQCFTDFGAKFLNYLKQEGLFSRMGEDLAAAAETGKGESNIDLFAICIADYISQRANKISYYRPANLDCTSEVSRKEYLSIKEELAFQNNNHKQMNKFLIDRNINLENKLREIKGSLRWKLTAPLIWVLDRFNVNLGEKKFEG